MKTTLLLMTLLMTAKSFAQIDRSNMFVFNTKLQGYTCERWGKKGFKTSEFEAQGYEFSGLDISRNTRRARIIVTEEATGCEYTALFDRERGNTFVVFASSSTKSEEQVSCEEMKADLDEFFAPGWNYKVSQNRFLSVFFPSEIQSQCNETTGKSYARFEYKLF